MSDESGDKRRPPTPERVLRGAHVLSAVVVRGFLETDAAILAIRAHDSNGQTTIQ